MHPDIKDRRIVSLLLLAVQSLVNIAWSFMTLLGNSFSQYDSVHLALRHIRLVVVRRCVGERRQRAPSYGIDMVESQESVQEGQGTGQDLRFPW